MARVDVRCHLTAQWKVIVGMGCHRRALLVAYGACFSTLCRPFLLPCLVCYGVINGHATSAVPVPLTYVVPELQRYCRVAPPLTKDGVLFELFIHLDYYTESGCHIHAFQSAVILSCQKHTPFPRFPMVTNYRSEGMSKGKRVVLFEKCLT